MREKIATAKTSPKGAKARAKRPRTRTVKVTAAADPYGPQKVYDAKKRAAGEHLQLGIALKREDDIELWERARAQHPDLDKVAVLRLALEALLQAKRS